LFSDHINSASGSGIYFFDKIATSSTYPLKTSNNTLDDGSGNMKIGGSITFPGTSGMAYIYAGTSGNYAFRLNLSNGNTIIEAQSSSSNLYLNYDHGSMIYFGNSGNAGYLDNNGNLTVSSVSAMTMYCPHYYADTLDDLALVKQYTAKTITENNIEKSIIDPASMSFLQAVSNPDYFDLAKTNGFILGCVRALVNRVEALENQLKTQQSAA
jgi:hypothetical protein